MASSRRRTREYLLQSLYARSELGEMYDRASFNSAYFENETDKSLEYHYIDTLESHILSHERDLLSIISSVAPKFDLQTMPVIHILILMIALSEILYTEGLDIPESVSVNEAIELAKRFSDDQGRMFVNGALSTFLKKREELIGKEYTGQFRVFR